MKQKIRLRLARLADDTGTVEAPDATATRRRTYLRPKRSNTATGQNQDLGLNFGGRTLSEVEIEVLTTVQQLKKRRGSYLVMAMRGPRARRPRPQP